MKLEKELEIAIQAVKNASMIAIKVQKSLQQGDVLDKQDSSPVTIADFACQAVINHDLRKFFPDDPVIGEEESNLLQENEKMKKKIINLIKPYLGKVDENILYKTIDHGTRQAEKKNRYWTLDPIDGTKGFLRGNQYAIALALIENGEVVLGIMACPNFSFAQIEGGSLYFAIKGQGAYGKSLGKNIVRKISVKNMNTIKETRFCESVEKDHAFKAAHKQIADLLGITKPPFRIDSQCKYSAVARGDASIYLRLHKNDIYKEKIWDHAAGFIILTEAGGRVTDLNDAPLDFSKGSRLETKGGIIATNGYLHQQVLRAANEVL